MLLRLAKGGGKKLSFIYKLFARELAVSCKGSEGFCSLASFVFFLKLRSSSFVFEKNVPNNVNKKRAVATAL